MNKLKNTWNTDPKKSNIQKIYRQVQNCGLSSTEKKKLFFKYYNLEKLWKQPLSKNNCSIPLTWVNVALVHWPIVDRVGTTVATNVTHLDIHDIARASRTYGVDHYFIVTPVQDQLMYVSRILDHWRIGLGSQYNPRRKSALTMVRTVETLPRLKEFCPTQNTLIATAARALKILTIKNYNEVKTEIQNIQQHNQRLVQEALATSKNFQHTISKIKTLTLVFGTGSGLHDLALKDCNNLLTPLQGSSPDDYRHLSVRSAVSIILDRLLGRE